MTTPESLNRARTAVDRAWATFDHANGPIVRTTEDTLIALRMVMDALEDMSRDAEG